MRLPPLSLSSCNEVFKPRQLGKICARRLSPLGLSSHAPWSHRHTCSRPPMLTDLTNQPTKQTSRKGGGEARKGTGSFVGFHCDPTESQEPWQPCEQNQCFHSSGPLQGQREADFSFSYNSDTVLFICKRQKM